MMKYTVRPLNIREAIIYGDLRDSETVKRNQIHQNRSDENDGRETLGDVFLKESLCGKDFDFPKTPTFKCLVCTSDLYEDYSNFMDFEDVDDFLINNGSDWQEGGLYNAAHIVKQDENSNIIEEMFYSAANRSYMDMKICSGNNNHLLEDIKSLVVVLL